MIEPKPKYGKIVKTFPMEDGVIILEDTSPRGHSNLYKIHLNGSLLWEAHLPRSNSLNDDNAVDPMGPCFMEGSITEGTRGDFVYSTAIYCETWQGHRCHICVYTGKLLHAFWRKD